MSFSITTQSDMDIYYDLQSIDGPWWMYELCACDGCDVNAIGYSDMPLWLYTRTEVTDRRFYTNIVAIGWARRQQPANPSERHIDDPLYQSTPPPEPPVGNAVSWTINADDLVEEEHSDDDILPISRGAIANLRSAAQRYTQLAENMEQTTVVPPPSEVAQTDTDRPDTLVPFSQRVETGDGPQRVRSRERTGVRRPLP